MIQLQIDGDGYDLDDDLRRHIEDKIGGLHRFMNTLDRGHVTVSWEGGAGERTKVSAQVWGGGHRFEASDTDRDAVTAVNRAYHELETQIRRKDGKEIAARDHG